MVVAYVIGNRNDNSLVFMTLAIGSIAAAVFFFERKNITDLAYLSSLCVFSLGFSRRIVRFLWNTSGMIIMCHQHN